MNRWPSLIVVVVVMASLGAVTLADASGRAEPSVPSRAATCDQKRHSLIRSLYRELLGRAPDAAGLAHFCDPKLTERDIRQAITNSAEYRQRVIRKLYVELLGREPDAAGTNFWLQAMQQQGMTPAQLRQAIMASPEYRQHVIRKLYVELLGREPDAAGINFWLQAMQQGMTEAQVRQAIMNSAEYKNKKS